MPKTFLIGDTHFGHQDIYEKVYNGVKFRPWDSCDEGDEIIVDRWNSVVNKNDTVIHVGDVIGYNIESLKILERLNGNKILIRGNHDIGELKEYSKYFSNIYGCYEFEDDTLVTHIPVHPILKSKYPANIHGHFHLIKIENNGVTDPWYFDVSVENINFTPILVEDAYEQIRIRKELFG